MEAKYREVCEGLGWVVYKYEAGLVEVSKHSPAGEDFFFGVSVENFVDEVKQYAPDFDVDDHVELLADNRGTNGVPGSFCELVEDAEAIKDMLQELAIALAKVKDTEI